MSDPRPGGGTERSTTLREMAEDSQVEFELLTDALLPAALFAMLGALVWFLIDVRAVLVEGPTSLLRFVFFFFMVAVVGIARIKSRDGSFHAAGYAAGLLLAMALFGYFFAYGGGRWGAGFGGGNPLLSMTTNYLIIAVIWFAGNYIVERTAIDPQSVAVSDAGLLSSEEWAREGERAGALRHRPHPGRTVMVFSLVAVAIFGIGHRFLAGHPEEQRHAFWCMVVCLGAALAVLAMAALCGLHVYVRQRGARLPATVVWLWLLLATPLAVAILGAAEATPKLEPAPGRWTPQLPPVVERLFTRWRDSPVSGLRRAEGSAAVHRGDGSGAADAGQGPRAEGRGQDARDGGARVGGEAGGSQAGEQTGVGDAPGGESGRGQEGSGGEGGDAGESRPDSARQGRRGETQPEGASGDEPSPEQRQGDQSEPRTGNEPGEPNAAQSNGSGLAATLLRVGIWLVLGAFAVALLVFLTMAALRLLRGRWPTAAGWLARLRDRFHRRPATGPARDPFVDPFGPRFRHLSPAEIVVHVYRAFQAYAALLGCPRRPDVTAHEFLAELPPSTDSWSQEIRSLTDLYAAAEYTPDSVDADCLEEVRRIWARLMQAVQELRR